MLIAEIMAGEPSDEFYDSKVKVLQEQIEHHVEEEEKRMEGLFAQARKAGLDMDALGEQLAARKQELTTEFEARRHSRAGADDDGRSKSSNPALTRREKSWITAGFPDPFRET